MYFPYAQENKAKGSWRREGSLYRVWLEPVIGDLPLKQVSPLHLERIKKNISSEGKSIRTAQYAMAVVRQVFNFARTHGLYSGDSPTSKIKIPQPDNNRLRFLSHPEAEALLAELQKENWALYEMAMLSLYCGLRAGEILQLTWGDVDLERRTLLIRSGKGNKTRVAFMTESVSKMLSKKIKDKPEVPVFRRRNGKPYAEVPRVFKVVVDRLGFNDHITDDRMKVVFHTLRHTYASWLVERGVDLYTVKELMGHSVLAMTERYSHFNRNTLQRAVRRLEKIAQD
jgi:integrase